MKIEFQNTKMLLANVNVRSEVRGEDREPAGDLKFECDVDSGFLANFHPALRSLLYWYDDSREHDLADKAMKEEGSGYAPDLRIPSIDPPIKLTDEVLNARLVVKHGNAEIGLAPVKVNNFALEPREGGSVSISFRVQCHPDEKAFGKLATLVQQEVEVTITVEAEQKQQSIPPAAS